MEAIINNFIDKVEDLYQPCGGHEDGFAAEFFKIKQQSAALKQDPNFKSSVGEDLKNKKKNRYKDILPFDYSRVTLPVSDPTTGDDYINASFIKGANQQKSYIASQGPLPHTVGDFWGMLWGYRVKVVVMVCREIELGKKKCERYWAGADNEPLEFLDIKVKLDSEVEIRKGIFQRHFTATKGTEERSFVQLQYQAWPDHGTPRTREEILTMIETARSFQPREEDQQTPLCVHCSAGCGRTGAILVIDYFQSLLQQKKLPPNLTVFDVVSAMRKQRPAIVQTKEQYEFVHLAVTEMFTDFLKASCGKAPNSKLSASLAHQNYENVVLATKPPGTQKPPGPQNYENVPDFKAPWNQGVSPKLTPTQGGFPRVTSAQGVSPKLTPGVTPKLTPSQGVSPKLTPSQGVTPKLTQGVTPKLTPAQGVSPRVTPAFGANPRETSPKMVNLKGVTPRGKTPQKIVVPRGSPPSKPHRPVSTFEPARSPLVDARKVSLGALPGGVGEKVAAGNARKNRSLERASPPTKPKPKTRAVINFAPPASNPDPKPSSPQTARTPKPKVPPAKPVRLSFNKTRPEGKSPRGTSPSDVTAGHDDVIDTVYAQASKTASYYSTVPTGDDVYSFATSTDTQPPLEGDYEEVRSSNGLHSASSNSFSSVSSSNSNGRGNKSRSQPLLTPSPSKELPPSLPDRTPESYQVVDPQSQTVSRQYEELAPSHEETGRRSSGATSYSKIKEKMAKTTSAFTDKIHNLKTSTTKNPEDDAHNRPRKTSHQPDPTLFGGQDFNFNKRIQRKPNGARKKPAHWQKI